VKVSHGGCVRQTGGNPAVAARISPTGVETIRNSNPSPDDHFAAGPDRCVIVSGLGRVGDARGCPSVNDGVVMPAGVQREEIGIFSAPNDHLVV